jgi:hypothetical protein
LLSEEQHQPSYLERELNCCQEGVSYIRLFRSSTAMFVEAC